MPRRIGVPVLPVAVRSGHVKRIVVPTGILVPSVVKALVQLMHIALHAPVVRERSIPVVHTHALLLRQRM